MERDPRNLSRLGYVRHYPAAQIAVPRAACPNGLVNTRSVPGRSAPSIHNLRAMPGDSGTWRREMFGLEITDLPSTVLASHADPRTLAELDIAPLKAGYLRNP